MQYPLSTFADAAPKVAATMTEDVGKAVHNRHHRLPADPPLAGSTTVASGTLWTPAGRGRRGRGEMPRCHAPCPRKFIVIPAGSATGFCRPESRERSSKHVASRSRSFVRNLEKLEPPAGRATMPPMHPPVGLACRREDTRTGGMRRKCTHGLSDPAWSESDSPRTRASTHPLLLHPQPRPVETLGSRPVATGISQPITRSRHWRHTRRARRRTPEAPPLLRRWRPT